jgi:hypothetical protein
VVLTFEGIKGSSGVPEAPSGYPSPPSSSKADSQLSSGARYKSARAGSPNACSNKAKGASRAITEQCERLLCGDMRQIFLGGRTDSPIVSSFSMDSICGGSSNINNYESDDYYDYGRENDMRFIEVWDYVGGTSFRGFIAEKNLPTGGVEKTLFLFFEHVAGTQLKHGYVFLF